MDTQQLTDYLKMILDVEQTIFIRKQLISELVSTMNSFRLPGYSNNAAIRKAEYDEYQSRRNYIKEQLNSLKKSNEKSQKL